VEHFVFDVVGKDTWPLESWSRSCWPAGADESVLMIKRPVMLDELIRHITSDYVVLEDLGRESAEDTMCNRRRAREDGLQSTVFCISGLVSEHLSNTRAYRDKRTS